MNGDGVISKAREKKTPPQTFWILLLLCFAYIFLFIYAVIEVVWKYFNNTSVKHDFDSFYLHLPREKT